ncbi:MAG: hypothetical protein MRJ93_11610 [Nitrososphaeraceae archaeon]|nr:hypothetical protein [Nitrososphaeraceae archaeon]
MSNNISCISNILEGVPESFISKALNSDLILKHSLESHKDKYKQVWSLSKIEEELVLHLNSFAYSEKIDDTENGNQIIRITHPYQLKAQYFLYRINISYPIPVFEIHESLLHPKLRQELIDLNKIGLYDFNKVITNAVKRLYESIDYEYFHTSGVAGKIYWRIVN